METFVSKDSIVRQIWGKGDTILFIFAGAAAEFALNKAVDWLYFTGRLPADPLGRLFSTVSYARQIVFLPKEAALKAIDKINNIHAGVEKARGAVIPDWAYRDVLFMLIDYSISAFELLERKLSDAEKEEVYNVFMRMGARMNVQQLPSRYADWLPVRAQHMETDLAKSKFTVDLFSQYKKHLGRPRYLLLLEAQALVVPKKVAQLLHFKSFSFLRPVVPLYKASRMVGLHWIIKWILLPAEYKQQIKDLETVPLNG